MKIIKDIEQGSEAWKQLRKEHFCASDAPAMMGDSRYKSRNQLLQEMKTGKTEEVSEAKQAIFDRGHQAENDARIIFEMDMLEDFPPAVCVELVEGMNLLASLDGLADPATAILEHKLWNDTLAANVSNEVLDPMYFWQLEHQLLVTGALCVYFVCSDGTTDNWMQMEYHSVPERREKLIAGWKQFAKDLIDYQPEVKQEAIVGEDAEAFPMITYQVEGSLVVSNIKDALPIIKARAEKEMSRVLETDQDFADKDKLNKATKEARAKLKDIISSVKGEFVSFKEFAETAEQIDSILQKMQSQGEKQVKEAKEGKKKNIIDGVDKKLVSYIDQCNEKISPLSLYNIMQKPLRPDFEGAMKNKRTIESLHNAVDSVLADAKIEIDQVMSRIEPNQIFLREHATEYAFLFNDVSQFINQETESFQAIVKQRIAEHKEAEEKRLEAERVRIREEEEQKAKKKLEQQQKDAEKIDEPAEEESVGQVQEDRISEGDNETQAIEPDVVEEPSFFDDLVQWASDSGVSKKQFESLVAIIDKHTK